MKKNKYTIKKPESTKKHKISKTKIGIIVGGSVILGSAAAGVGITLGLINSNNGNKKSLLDVAKEDAKTKLDKILPTKTLDAGATPPQAEKAVYDKSLIDAKAEIDRASTIAEVSSKLAAETTKVTTARDTYDAAIQAANDAKSAKDLATAKTKAKADLDQILPTKTLDAGATPPQTEKAAYDKSLVDAKADIDSASTTTEVTAKLAAEKPKVTTTRNAYDAAIEAANKANDAKTAKDLATAKTKAKADLDQILPTKTLDAGATPPQTEKAAYDKSLVDAKADIDSASTTTEVTAKLAAEKPKVTTTRNAYDAAIEAANKANDAKTAKDLATAKTKAKADLDQILPTKTLDAGATPPQTEKAAYDKSLVDAKADIDSASTTTEVTAKLAAEKPKVTTTRNAYDAAIEAANKANDAKTAKDLATAKTKAKADLDQILPTKTLDAGATPPQTEKAAYDKSLVDAKADIDSASTTTEVTAKLAAEKPKVTTTRNAYDAAIEAANKANDAKTAKDLATAKTKAKADLDQILPTKTLDAGATPPQTEKAAYDKSLVDAKADIDSASTTTEVTAKLAAEKPKVTTTRNAYDAAIEAANDAKTTKDLATAKTKAKADLDQILPTKTLDAGATPPQTEKAAYDKSLVDAKADIDSASTTTEVTAKLAAEKPKVTTTRNAYDAAIDATNVSKEAKDLVDAIANAKKDLKAIKPTKTLINGATPPQTEKADYDKSIADAIADIVTKDPLVAPQSPDEVADMAAIAEPYIKTARDAYDAAIEAANKAKEAKDLATAKGNAKIELSKIKPTKTLIKGAVEPKTEKAVYDKSLVDAKAEIDSAPTTAEVTAKKAAETTKVTSARDAADAAIEAANKAKDLVDAKTSAKTAIDKIKQTVHAGYGNVHIHDLQDAYEKSLIDGKKAIDSASTTTEVAAKKTTETQKVTNARDALDAAIRAFENSKTKNLSSARRAAEQGIEAIKPTETLMKGKTIPQAEQDAYDQAIAEAKDNINDDSAFSSITSISDLNFELPRIRISVIGSRDALDAAIRAANKK